MSLYELYVKFIYEVFKLAVNVAIYIWIAVSGTAFFAFFAGQKIGSSLIVSLLNLFVLIYLQAGINIIKKRSNENE